MRTARASETEVVIIATFDELDRLRSAITMRHNDFCFSYDDCKCMSIVAELADPA